MTAPADPVRISRRRSRPPHASPAAVCLVLVALGGGCEKDLRPRRSTTSGSGTALDPSHAKWGRLLARHVRDGRVDYRALRKDPAALADYLGDLEGVTGDEYESWTREQQIAFWINAYNAYTVKLVVDHYPLESIRDVGGLLSSVFSKEFIPFEQLLRQTLSLDDIEHGILRTEFKDPRFHFALVCASKSCPRLASEPYVGERLEAQLESRARTFLGDTRFNRYEPDSGKLFLSAIFDWYAGDFEEAKGSVAAYVAGYMGTPATAEIEYLEYDWTLNDDTEREHRTEGGGQGE